MRSRGRRDRQRKPRRRSPKTTRGAGSSSTARPVSRHPLYGEIPSIEIKTPSGYSLQWLFFAALVLAAGSTQAEEAEPPGGAELLAPFKRELQQALRAGLARGPVEALGACREQAPEIASSLSRDGIRLGRTSHRLRNPANAAPEWVVPILEGYLAEPSSRAPTTLPLADGRSGYVEPIPLQPLCTTCHGEALAPDVAARIEDLYPEDRAVGFQVGELRGVFWIEFPAE